MRKGGLLWVGIALIGAAFAYSYWPAQKGKLEQGSNPEAMGQGLPTLVGGQVDAAVVARDSTQSQKASAPPTHPFPEMSSSREGLSLTDDPFGATSKAEQYWLDGHGFPNEQQWAAYSTASDGLLEQAAAAGDSVAKTMLDIRKLPTDPEAKTRLVEAGSEGDLFALNSLAAYLAGSRDGDILAAHAVSRVAEMKGDLRLGAARDFMMPRELDPAEKLIAEADALRLYNQLNLIYRERHGVDPPQSVSRPILNPSE